MRYRIRHRTTYGYASPVFESFNEVRLQPLVCATQSLLDFDLRIEPPATVIAFRDYYGNARARLRRPLPARAARDRGDERRRDPRAARTSRWAARPTASPTPRRRSRRSRRRRARRRLRRVPGPSAYIVLGDDSAAHRASALLEPRTRTRPRSRFLTARVDHVRTTPRVPGRHDDGATARWPRCSRAAAASARTSRTC